MIMTNFHEVNEQAPKKVIHDSKVANTMQLTIVQELKLVGTYD